MLGSTFIEAGIGLSMIFLLMSLMCSVVCEIIARVRESRSTYLFRAIDGLVDKPGLGELVQKHALVQGLGYKDKDGVWNKPSYVPSSIFGRVALDLIARYATPIAPAAAAPARSLAPGAEMVSAFVQGAQAARAKPASVSAPSADELAVAALQAALAALIPKALTTTEDEVKAIGVWFDAAMERISGTYKRSTQLTVFMLAVALTLGLNVDTLVVGNRLQRDKSLRDAVVASATSFANEHKDLGAVSPASPTLNDPAAPAATGEAQSRLLALEVQLEQLNLPIGWPTDGVLEDAKDKVTAASKALEAATAYAKVPASVAAAARDDLKKKGEAVVAAPAGTDEQSKARALLVVAYDAAKAAVIAANSEDEKSRKAVAEASLMSEHLKLNESEMRARTLTLAGSGTGDKVLNVLMRLLGWLLTAIAVSLGTRFWFDTLSRLMSIRSGVKPDEKKGTT